MSLTSHIRTLTGVAAAELDDVAVRDELEQHRSWLDGVTIQWASTTVALIPRLQRAMVEPGAAGTAGVVALTDSDDAAVTGWSISRDGVLTFAAAQVDEPALTINGWAYDVYAAAAVILEGMAARRALDHDFSTDGQDFKRSQQVQQLLSLADSYKRRRVTRVVRMRRGDEAAAIVRVNARRRG